MYSDHFFGEYSPYNFKVAEKRMATLFINSIYNIKDMDKR